MSGSLPVATVGAMSRKCQDPTFKSRR